MKSCENSLFRNPEIVHPMQTQTPFVNKLVTDLKAHRAT